MTNSEFETMTFRTEDEALDAGIEQYGFVQLVTSRNPDGSWYVYPTSDKIGVFVHERKFTYEKSPVSWKDVVAAIVIGGLLGFLLTQGWNLR